MVGIMRQGIGAVLFILFTLITSNQYYKYKGCFKKVLSGTLTQPKVFNKEYHVLPRLALSLCLIHCEKYTYEYSAIDSTHCGCSHTTHHMQKATGCNVPCTEKPFPSVPCGGPMRLSIYKATDKRYKAIYVGCYKLLPLDEDKAMVPLRDNSPYSSAAHLVTRFVASSCIKHCSKSGFTFAAIFNGDFCGCDTRVNHIWNVRNVHCVYPCEDVKLGTCGTYNDEPLISVWKSDPGAVKLLAKAVDPNFNEKEFIEELDADSEDSDDLVQEFTITANGAVEWTNKESEKKAFVRVEHEEEGSGGHSNETVIEEEGSGGYKENPPDVEGSGQMPGVKTGKKGKGKTDFFDKEEENLEEDEAGSLGVPIGIGVGVVVALVAGAVAAVFFWRRRKKKKKGDEEKSGKDENEDKDGEEEEDDEAEENEKTEEVGQDEPAADRSPSPPDRSSRRHRSSREDGTEHRSSREHRSSSRHRSSREHRSSRDRESSRHRSSRDRESSRHRSSRRHRSREHEDKSPLLD